MPICDYRLATEEHSPASNASSIEKTPQNTNNTFLLQNQNNYYIITMKIVIIGGVAGGASAAPRARRLDEKAEIIVLQ